MRLEHLALQVADPPAMADWYVRHLGFTIARQENQSPHGHFLMTGDGRVMIEVYHKPELSTPDYAATDMGVLHLAFVTQDAEADRDRLVAAGCTVESEVGGNESQEDHVVNLRDPWGLSIQLCRRALPMLRG